MNEHCSESRTLIARGALRELWRVRGALEGVLVPNSRDRERWDGIDPVSARDIRQASARDRDDPWPVPLLSQWSAYARTGDRDEYESRVFDRCARVQRAVLAALIEPCEDTVGAAADGLWLLCEQSTWCWPAHDDAFGRGRATPDLSRPYVDLGAGEMAALLAWSLLVLGPDLDEYASGLSARIRREIDSRLLRPLLERAPWPWEGAEARVHNWAPWIFSNVIAAAVVSEDGDLRSRAIDHAVDGLDRYLAQLPSDGAIDEGFSYWWQGAARALDGLLLLDALAHGELLRDAADGPLAGVSELLRFPQRVQFSSEWFASFSDAEPRNSSELPWRGLHHAARIWGADDVQEFAAHYRVPERVIPDGHAVTVGLGRTLAALTDSVWRDVRVGVLPFPSATVFPSLDVAIQRQVEGTAEGLAVLVKGGRNDENHNHLDLGSLQVAVDGIPLVIDLGRAEYRAETFSDRRYELWYVRDEWHSGPLPHAVQQEPGSASAPLIVTDHDVTVRLHDVYGFTWDRTVTLDAGVIIHDAFPAGEGRIVFVCPGIPRVTDGDVLISAPGGGRGLRVTHDGASVEVETRALSDRYLVAAWGSEVSRVVISARDDATMLRTEGMVVS